MDEYNFNNVLEHLSCDTEAVHCLKLACYHYDQTSQVPVLKELYHGYYDRQTSQMLFKRQTIVFPTSTYQHTVFPVKVMFQSSCVSTQLVEDTSSFIKHEFSARANDLTASDTYDETLYNPSC